jgi:hypothetical protein
VRAGAPDAAGSAWVEPDPAERAGLFTRAAFLALYAGGEVQSPIRRGVFILERALCVPLGEPPPNASDTPVTGGNVEGEPEVRSVRQDVAAKTSGGVCSGCHDVINPIGFALEHYDALGRFQTEELHVGANGDPVALPIDASGDLPQSDVAGALAGGVELSERLAGSRQAQACFAQRWLARALAREPAEADACSLHAAADALAGSGDMRALLDAIVQGDAFRHVRAAGDAGEEP